MFLPPPISPPPTHFLIVVPAKEFTLWKKLELKLDFRDLSKSCHCQNWVGHAVTCALHGVSTFLTNWQLWSVPELTTHTPVWMLSKCKEWVKLHLDCLFHSNLVQSAWLTVTRACFFLLLLWAEIWRSSCGGSKFGRTPRIKLIELALMI